MMDPSPPDPLSSLPAHLLDEILARLGLRDAVRTSALSRAWRRRWEYITALALSFPDGTPPSAVDSVLLRYAAPRVSRFASHVDAASAARLHDWLIALSRRGVQSIDLRASAGHFVVHSSIFSCARLVSLHLDYCNIPPITVGFAGFPVLEELKLVDVHFPIYEEGQLEAVVRGSPLLRFLTLDNVMVPEFWDSVIEAPNLHTLTISSEDDHGWRCGQLPCLEDANIDVMSYPQHGHDFGEFIAGLAQVRNLTLYSPDDEVQILDTLPFTFHNLKNLKLSTRFTQMPPILLMFCVLRSSPNLEKLEIEIHDGAKQEVEANLEFLNAQWTDGMCANLQVVQMIDVGRLPNEMSFMKLILSKARLLRTLSVDKCPVSLEDPLNELLKCRSASAQAQVLFKGSLGEY